jgi:LysR family transcriptional regulator, transcriptional activator of nhaA
MGTWSTDDFGARLPTLMEWLNYHHLLYFWMVAREQGLAPAGKILRLSQSALSGQIKRLEENLGQPLFERRGRRLEMTETGRIVYKYADEIFGLGREMMDAVKGRPTRLAQRLTVGVSDVVPKMLLRTLLEPALKMEALLLTCKEDRFDRLLSELADGAVDIVIADSAVPPDSTIRAYNHLLGESTVSVLGPASMATAARKTFPASLASVPMLLPTVGSALRRNIDGWFSTLELSPRIIAEADDSALLKAFAADGMGAVFVPTVISKTVSKRYGLVEIGTVESIHERYYAISVERRLIHPAVVAIRAAATNSLFK